MDIEDFFEHDKKHNRHNNYRNDDYRNSHHDNHTHHDIKQQLFNTLQNNPKLKRLILIAALLLLTLLVVIIFLLFPLITKLFDYILQNGLKGIIETIWKGTK